MPAPIYYAHLILRRISEMRRNRDVAVAGLLPDAKSQVTLRYVDGKPVGATSVVVSTQHEEGLAQSHIKALLAPIIESSLPPGWMPPDDEIYVNGPGPRAAERLRPLRAAPARRATLGRQERWPRARIVSIMAPRAVPAAQGI